MRRTRAPRRTLIPALALLLAAGACAPGGDDDGAVGASGAPPASWVETLGSDTLGVERVERRDDGFSGTFVARSPSTVVLEYDATVDDRGRIAELVVESRTPAGEESGTATVRARLEGDSVVFERTEAGETTRSAVEAPEVAILAPNRIPVPWAFVEHAVGRWRAEGGGPMTFAWVQPGGRVIPSEIRSREGDVVEVMTFGTPMLVEVGPDGHLRGADGSETTLKVVVAPTAEPMDAEALAGLAAGYGDRDARGEGVGQPSPGAEVSERIGGATLTVAYSRPAMRGREIWGGLVPRGEVWRTGANAATSFTTDRALVMGEGTEIPAGSYTLWSIYGPDSGELVVNGQTGQWGTQYDPEQDVARIPMRLETADSTAERFTIGIEPADGGGGRLTLTWADRTWVVPFTVR